MSLIIKEFPKIKNSINASEFLFRNIGFRKWNKFWALKLMKNPYGGWLRKICRGSKIRLPAKSILTSLVWGVVDKMKTGTRKVMRSNHANDFLFIFQLENIWRSNLKFSTSYGRQTDLKFILGLLLVISIWLEENISLKYLLIGGVDVCPPHAQTVSTSLMPRLVNL